jgi:alkylated DNA nucleotide flippase Atl1
MPTLDFGVQQTHVNVRVQIRGPGGETVTHEVPSGEFEAAELGVQISQLFVPWARVIEYDWTVHQEAITDRTRDGARLRVKIMIEDGTAEGSAYDVPADRFEKSAMTLTILFDRHVEPDTGMLVIQKLFIPWHRVVSFERYATEADPQRGVVMVPDAQRAAEGRAAPARPDMT